MEAVLRVAPKDLRVLVRSVDNRRASIDDAAVAAAAAAWLLKPLKIR